MQAPAMAMNFSKVDDDIVWRATFQTAPKGPDIGELGMFGDSIRTFMCSLVFSQQRWTVAIVLLLLH